MTLSGPRGQEMSRKQLNRDEICALIPHRPPFLLVDEVLAYELGSSIVGLKRISPADPVFAGHFPGNPIYPGVLIVEALAQTSLILIKLSPGEHDNRLFLFASIKKMRFHKPVYPGDELQLEATLDRWLDGTGISTVVAKVKGEVVAKGELIVSSVESRV